MKRKTPFVIFCILMLSMIAGGCVLAKNIFFPDGLDIIESDPVGLVGEGRRLNVLLMGIDARKGENMGRSDTMILASIDPKSKQVALLSIPRDTRVNIPGHGWDKINSAVVYGGPELSAKVVSNLLGIQVKDYLLADFNGFKDVVDVLGGVTMNVEQNMYHWDDSDGGIYQINLKKGLQRLDGDKALQYVRFRDYAMGDVDRTKYQQKFLVALAKEILQTGTIPKLPKLVPEINKCVKTNMGLGDMIKMASAAKNLENSNIVTQTLPGRPLDIGGSYWGVDPKEARQVVARLFKGEVTADVVLSTPLSSQYSGPVESKPAAGATEEKLSAAGPSNKKTQQDQKGTNKTPAIPGQGAKSGNSGSSDGMVTITPVETGTDTTPGTTPGKTPTGTQPDTGTGEPDKTNTDGAGGEGINPGIPGASKINASTS